MAVRNTSIYFGGTKKKTRQGQSKFTKYGSPGTNGGNKGYKKKNRGQGK